MLNKKIMPPFRYPGSKFRAYKYIQPYIEQIEFSEYREAFFGGGGIFFANKFNPDTKIWINDLDKDLINAYQTIQNPDGLKYMLENIDNYNPSKENFNILRDKLSTSNFESATKYFLINRTAYSGIMNLPNWGFHPTKSVQPDKWPARLIDANNKLINCRITSLDFEDVINEDSNHKVLLFLDPPYYAADQKRAYVKFFTIEDHIRLCNCLKNTKHKFILTYDDCSEIRKMYSWANINSESWRYQTANSLKSTRKIGNELIITNF